MKTTCCWMMVLASAALGVAAGAERNMANGFAAAGAAQAANGNTEKARDLLYKALVYDDSCPDALYELARILDKDNHPSAADFYRRAMMGYEKEKNTAAAPKRAEAERRLKVLDNYFPRFNAAVEEYAQDLDKLVKKNADPVTKDAASERVTKLDLPTLLPPDKVPKFYVAPPVVKAKVPDDKPAAPAGIPPDVERELKALGWANFKGSISKKSPGVYVFSDARLEAPKLNGGIDFILHKTGLEGSVSATVRSEFGDNSPEVKKARKRSKENMEGYGFLCDEAEFSEFTPSSGSGEGKKGSGTLKAVPALFLSHKYTDAKTHFAVTAVESDIDLYVNDKRAAHSGNTRIAHGGTMVLEVMGTATIENPRCAGK